MKEFQKFFALFITFIALISFLSTGCSKYDDKLNDELVKAVERKDVQTVKDLIAKRANPDALDSKGNPVLMKVMLEMQISLNDLSSGTISGDEKAKEVIEIVKILVDAGADVNLKNKAGIPLLVAAITRGDMEIVNLLISHGADVNAKDSSGTTILISAAFTGNDELVNTLVEKGAEVNAVGKDGASALLVATYRNRPEMAKILIDKGADVNVKIDAGTPVLFASAYGDLGTVKLLTEKGADINARDNKGNSPLSIARFRKHSDVVEFLEKSGAKE